MHNLLTNLPAALPDERFDTLLSAEGLTIERIVSLGHVSPPGFWYDEPRHEWVLVVEGAARLRFEDEPEPVELRRGDCLNIPAHRRHRVEWTQPDGPTIWLAVYYARP
jgi:cupin 2 domain-containing protein